jgi:hypothetical protein
MADFEIQHEVVSDVEAGEWTLCFQWGTYRYEDGGAQTGYRFIWRRPNQNLQPARAQARIPSAAVLLELLQRATEAGWFITCERGQEETAAA